MRPKCTPSNLVFKRTFVLLRTITFQNSAQLPSRGTLASTSQLLSQSILAEPDESPCGVRRNKPNLFCPNNFRVNSPWLNWNRTSWILTPQCRQCSTLLVTWNFEYELNPDLKWNLNIESQSQQSCWVEVWTIEFWMPGLLTSKGRKSVALWTK